VVLVNFFLIFLIFLAFRDHNIPLLKQLAVGGRFVAPVWDKPNNSDRQHVWTYDKVSKDKIIKKRGPPLPYVDVQDNKKQLKRGESNIYVHSR